MRHDGRTPEQARPCTIQRGFTELPPGSVLIRTGRTQVLCTATVSTALPPWREPSGLGWVTAEYEMLPGSTGQRKPRSRLKVDGRTQEIQRLIGRSLRAVIDFAALGPNLITIDCDVLQADGGTRTAAVTGAYVALCDAIAFGRREGLWSGEILRTGVAAVSVGIVDGQALLDLDYREDASAEVDCNLVMTGHGEWIEVQATGEKAVFSDAQLARMLQLGRAGIEQLFQLQQSALEQTP